jgi:hypothetical protein
MTLFWCNGGGYKALQEHLRSVISHPLGLPLTVALHGQKPEDLPYLSRQRRNLTNDNDLDQILQISVQYCQSQQTAWNETDLTEQLAKTIKEISDQTGLYADREVFLTASSDQCDRLDVRLCSENVECLAVIQVGLDNTTWWDEFHQSFKYIINIMLKPSNVGVKQTQPLLLATLTIDPESFEGKLGVFLCVPTSSESKTYNRMILLGHTHSTTLKDASQAFGQFLRTTSWCSDWISLTPDNADDYRYLSPHCCLVRGNNETTKHVSMIGKSERIYKTLMQFYRTAQTNGLVSGCFTCLVDSAML